MLFNKKEYNLICNFQAVNNEKMHINLCYHIELNKFNAVIIH